MLTTEEIKSLCEAAGLKFGTRHITSYEWYAAIYMHSNTYLTSNMYWESTARTETAAANKAWEAYVNNRRD